jgi:hypothetical protein
MYMCFVFQIFILVVALILYNAFIGMQFVNK